MKKILVYCLTCDGSTAIYFDMQDLCEALTMEFEDQDHNSMEGIEYKVTTKEMTEKEIEDLPEFDGF